ncbi:hypothetical protein C0J52_17092 [Blattella germanica]|nr:hypothetical protein C0J52_17092 [Blattella germanica]
MRSVCTAAIYEKYEKMGGLRKRVEVGVISLGTTSQDGHMRQVKVEVLGVMDPENKQQWVDKDSIILTDFTVDKGTLHSMGFSSVYQVSVNDTPSPQNKYSNQNNTLSLLSRQIIQQFLDELVWRERWGPVAAQAFDNIIAHIAEQTKLETDDTLSNKLGKIAANPFKNWSYANWTSSSPTPKTPISQEAEPESVPEPQLPELPPTGPISSIDMLPQSIRTVDPPPAPAVTKRNRKRQATSLDAPEPKKVAIGPSPCCVCPRKYTNNLALMKHLIMHTQSENQFSTELSDLTQCKYCLKSFPTPFAMQTHIEEIHLKTTTSMVCRICEEKFRDKITLIAHMHRTHVTIELPYECGICRFRSSMHRDLIDHFYEVHGGGENLQCPFCLKTVAFANYGKRMSANVNFFLNHIQIDIILLCLFALPTGVKPYVSTVGAVEVMMPPPPPQSHLYSERKRTRNRPPSSDFMNKKFEPPIAIYGVQTGAVCSNHLARCERKSAYPSPAAAKAATIQSASFPPLVTLDDADNASEDPSDRWLKAFVPSTEGGDPPSMLNILGLVRKPSTDESSLDRAPSDSEGLPESKTDQPQQEEVSKPEQQEPSEVAEVEAAKSEGEPAAIPVANEEEDEEEKMDVDEVEADQDTAMETEDRTSLLGTEENSQGSEARAPPSPAAASESRSSLPEENRAPSSLSVENGNKDSVENEGDDLLLEEEAPTATNEEGEAAPSVTNEAEEEKVADDAPSLPSTENVENSDTVMQNASLDENAVPLLEESAESTLPQVAPQEALDGATE